MSVEGVGPSHPKAAASKTAVSSVPPHARIGGDPRASTVSRSPSKLGWLRGVSHCPHDDASRIRTDTTQPLKLLTLPVGLPRHSCWRPDSNRHRLDSESSLSAKLEYASMYIQGLGLEPSARALWEPDHHPVDCPA